MHEPFLHLTVSVAAASATVGVVDVERGEGGGAILGSAAGGSVFIADAGCAVQAVSLIIVS